MILPQPTISNADWAKAHSKNAWQRMGGGASPLGDGPYLHDMETRQLLMQSAQVYALLAIADALVGSVPVTPKGPQ